MPEPLTVQEQFATEYNPYGINTAGLPLTSQMGGLNSALPNLIDGYTRPQGIGGGQINAPLNVIPVGATVIVLSSEGNIQAALDALATNGGLLHLIAGTYQVTSALIVPALVTIEGDTAATTIINFNSTAANFQLTGTNVYTTGTIASISGGVNVVGSGTTWTVAMVGRQIFINNRWYVIAAFTDTTHITIATGYADGATFSGNYRISSVIREVEFKQLTIKSSTGTAIVGTDVRDLLIRECTILSNNKGFTFTNFMNVDVELTTIASSTSDGYGLTNGSFFDAAQFASVSNGGHGGNLNTIKSSEISFSACDSNTLDGLHLRTVTNSLFKMELSGNGDQGVELVSACDSVFINDSLINNNTSDGVKLTASATNCIIGAACNISGNGGYGVNIVDSTSTNTRIGLTYFASNTSGAVNDTGVGTVIRGNIGINDNITGLFGGTGADLALSISSGTTTLSLASATSFIKNYSSISITGTGTLAFSNPNTNGSIIILKSQGDVTLTSSSAPMIDASGMGAAGGTAGAGDGNVGISGQAIWATTNGGGGGFRPVLVSDSGAAGAASAALSPSYTLNDTIYHVVRWSIGAGGGGGGGAKSGGGGGGGGGANVSAGSAGNAGATGNAGLTGPGAGGNGGVGGAFLIIECGGKLNFTTTSGISVNGLVGAVGNNGSATNDGGGGGGGGGAGGVCVIIYNALTASSGTITKAGGLGGAGGTPVGLGGVGGNGGAGAAGLSLVILNTAFA